MRVPSGKGLAVDWQHLEPTCGMVSGFPSIQPSQPAPLPVLCLSIPTIIHTLHSTLYTIVIVLLSYLRSGVLQGDTHSRTTKVLILFSPFDYCYPVIRFLLLPHRDFGAFPTLGGLIRSPHGAFLFFQHPQLELLLSAALAVTFAPHSVTAVHQS
ncbi:hypothetical protein HDV57DRAFT_291613 [Trichoderma longibrachiatum]